MRLCSRPFMQIHFPVPTETFSQFMAFIKLIIKLINDRAFWTARSNLKLKVTNLSNFFRLSNIQSDVFYFANLSGGDILFKCPAEEFFYAGQFSCYKIAKSGIIL